jgi:hypothetical protein
MFTYLFYDSLNCALCVSDDKEILNYKDTKSQDELNTGSKTQAYVESYPYRRT